MTCKTTTRNLTCISDFSLGICQYLVLQVSAIKSLRITSNFRFPDQQTSPTKELSKIFSALLTKNLLHSTQTKKKNVSIAIKLFFYSHSSAKETTYHRISEVCKATRMPLCLFQHLTYTSVCLMDIKLTPPCLLYIQEQAIYLASGIHTHKPGANH